MLASIGVSKGAISEWRQPTEAAGVAWDVARDPDDSEVEGGLFDTLDAIRKFCDLGADFRARADYRSCGAQFNALADHRVWPAV
jgi:hypothetical protein